MHMTTPPGQPKRKFVGPIQEGVKRFRSHLHLSSAGTGSSASSAPGTASTPPSPSTVIHSSPFHTHSSPGWVTPTTSTLIEPNPAPAITGTRIKSAVTSSIKHATIAGLESAFQTLHLTASAVPVLKPAVDGLIDCLDIVQASTSSAKEYEEIIANINILATSLKEYLNECDSEVPSDDPACALIASNIEKEILHIKSQQGRNAVRRALESVNDKEDVMKCYRRVEGLFQQLQSNICLQTLKKSNKQYMASLIERLHPVDDARYDSRYSTTLRRRGCTKETRKQVQEDLQNWVQDPNGAKIYWMNGMAGTGKTTIAYSLCEWLEAQKQLGASFFCSRVSSSCRNVDSIVPTIAYDLACYSVAFAAKLGKVLEEQPSTSARDVDRQFEKLIQGPVMAVKDMIPQGVVVVIDALDECEDSYRVEMILQALLRLGADLPLKYFIASRPEPVILEKMLELAENSRAILHLHDIEQSIVEEDIKKYLQDELRVMSPPPDVKQIDRLAKLAGKLFIYAATVTRYILPGPTAVNSVARLKAVLAAGSSITNSAGSGRKYKQLDELYATVLATSLDEEILEPEEIEAVQLVLWTVVSAEEPMTISTLSSFLSLDKIQVSLVVKSLRSVLHISESNGLVSTLHASFPDYMFDRSRCGRYYCNLHQHSELLARRCFEIMKMQLRFNICNLESSFVFDKDISDLEQRIANSISCELVYACLHWGEHLRRAGIKSDLCDELVSFLSCRLLFWTEVLNLKQKISHGENVLSQVLAWPPLRGETKSTELRDFVYDARNFLTTFSGNPTSQSTPHIYLSVLPFTSKQSRVWKAYIPQMQGLIHIEGAIAEGRANFALAAWDIGSDVHGVAQSSDGKQIASSSSNNRSTIWDASTGTRILGLLGGHENSIQSLAFSPDNTRIASGSVDCTICIWDAQSGGLLIPPLHGHTSYVCSVAFSPDGTCVASGSADRTVRLWDAHTGAPIGNPYRGDQFGVASVIFSPDGEHLASGGWDSTIRVWNWRTGMAAREPIEGHSRMIHSVAYSSDGLHLASGSEDCTVRVWNMPSGTLLAGPFEGHTSGVSSVSFSPNNTQTVSGSWDCTVRVWDTESGTLLAGPFQGHNGIIRAVFFTVDGTRILSGSSDGTIRVWDARPGTTATTKSSGHAGAILSVALSPDGTLVASGSFDKSICVWDTRSGALVAGPFNGHTSDVNSVVFSPNGTRILSGSTDRTLRIWDAYTGILLVGPMIGHADDITSVAFSPNGCQVASGSADDTVRLWDSHTGQPATKPFEGHARTVASIAFSHDSARIVSGSYDKTVRMWDTDGITLWVSDAHTDWVRCVAFSPDGTRVLAGLGNRTILVLDTRGGAVLRTPFRGNTSSEYSAAFSPDGMRVVSGSWDKSVRVWDVQSGTMVAGPLKGHTNWVRSVAFSPDGARIASGSADRTIRFWDVTAATQTDATSFHDLSMSSDGWLTNSDSQPLIWVPSELRRDFSLPTPSNPIVINGNCSTSIHHSTLFLGDRWHECFCVSPSPAS